MQFVLPAFFAKKAASSSVIPSGAASAQRSRENRDLRDLLHVRLRGCYSIGLFFSLCFNLYLLRTDSISRILSLIAMTCTLIAPTILLWKKQDLGLSWLRRLERLLLLLGFFGLFYLSQLRIRVVHAAPPLPAAALALLSGADHQWLFANGGLYFPNGVGSFCSPIILFWVSFMVCYAVIIPNTWRRSALILSLMTLSALFCVGYGVHKHAALHPFFGICLFYTFFTCAGFAAMSLYGSHKLEVLRSEVLAAMQVGQYLLKGQLGKGGMGEVYLAQHRMLRRPCAVKLIRPEHAGDSASLQRFEREVQAMAQLTHPNTVEIYDYGRTQDGMFYYAMEYLPGLSAEELIRRHGVISPPRAVHFLRQVCGALSEAHAAGLIHRGIRGLSKPREALGF